MTQLIVALDTEASFRHIVALRQAGVMFFKLNATTLINPSLFEYLTLLSKLSADIFLDLKIYDTRDTVERIARRAFDIGAKFLTVYAAASMLEAAMRAKPPSDYHKVLAVGPLTDSASPSVFPSSAQSDGLILPVDLTRAVRRSYRGVIVCPGIRISSTANPGNHVSPATPAEAMAAGADYIVVGRPIIDAENPAAVARLIIAALSSTPALDASGAAQSFSDDVRETTRLDKV